MEKPNENVKYNDTSWEPYKNLKKHSGKVRPRGPIEHIKFYQILKLVIYYN